MTTPLEPTTLEVSPVHEQGVQGRSPWQIAWRRLRRDRAFVVSAITVLVLVVVAVVAPLLTRLNGHPPTTFYPGQVDPALGGLPRGDWGGISGDFWFGVEPGTGRDLFSRIVWGARVSLLIGVFAALLSTAIGTTMGLVAGYLGGWIDSAISRVMDVLLSFPALIFMIALVSVLPDVERTTMLVLVIGFFGWPYVGRIVRGQTLSLARREFVDASRSLGAGHASVIFREILPNLVAPVLVVTTLFIPNAIATEAGLSFLGIGVRPPTPSWGQMLSAAVQWYTVDPLYFLIPGAFLFVTVLAFNLLGDELRDALSPGGPR